MIKLIIWDLDGVLADLRHVHYESLNRALSCIDSKHIITEEEHIKIFDGLTTSDKLTMLVTTKSFPQNHVEEVKKLKQQYTIEVVKNLIPDLRLAGILARFKYEGFKMYVASNAVGETVQNSLEALGIDMYFDKIYSNENAVNNKPHPEIYLRCMADAGVAPYETIIVEDSKNGRIAASKSGAFVCGVDNPFDVTFEKIRQAIKSSASKPICTKWPGHDCTVLIPMSGLGQRFIDSGYTVPKPLIDINGKPMIQAVVENLNIDAHFIFVVQKSHYEQYSLGTVLPLIAPGCNVIQIDGQTAGAACTTLLAKQFINNDKHLIIANSDQILDWSSSDFMYSAISNGLDCSILTFNGSGPKWSYALTDSAGAVLEVAEKRQISNEATCGVYYFKRGSDYVTAAETMIAADDKTNGEFYVAPAINYLIKAGKQAKTYGIHQDRFHPVGTPVDLEYYLNHCQ